ncbi:MAG TPA: LLM class F420-dependent oxidoreductase [Acidimicrobiales bacterium]|nr:LLM class F420-dependent oxidoreductase [Acidimicrobiales bacterium]
MAYGITVPFDGSSLLEQWELIRRLPDLGYTDAWSSEAEGTDAFTPLALAAAWAPGLRLGTAIVPVFTRGPALLAQSAAALAEAAPGRFALGLGTSSPVVVEGWNAMSFDRPLARVRDLLAFLPLAFAGGRVEQDFETFSVHGYRLGRPPASPPPLLVAALRPGMLRLAGRAADGVILNWLSAADVPRALAEVRAGAAAGPAAGEGRPAPEVVARLFVCPSTDTETVRAQAKRLLSVYLNIPAYAAFHEWLGRGSLLAETWAAWRAGDRRAATSAVPDVVVDDLVLHGHPDQIRERVQAYVEAGVTTPVLAVLPLAGVDVGHAVEDLAPG